jgi:hypothetical protein
MTPEGFLEYIGEGTIHRCQGKSRANLIRARYLAYVKAYQVETFCAAYHLFMNRADAAATSRGLRDRDDGKPMVMVPEIL